jgi:hypothetical protein
MEYNICKLLFLLFFLNYPAFAEPYLGDDTEININYVYTDMDNNIFRFIRIRFMIIGSSNYEIDIEIETKDTVNGNKFKLKALRIDEEYFYSIYERLMNINFNEIVRINNEPGFIEGEFLSIIIGTRNCDLVLRIRNPALSIYERKLDELNLILIDIFQKVDLINFYGNLKDVNVME